jgi:NAD(P)-dependent dehydrogenase (short-subunit alcohol dehydrogenase family)
LGLELARLWSAEGARVAICSRSENEVHAAVDELGLNAREVFGQVCDVTDQQQVKSFIEEVSRRWGGVDVLVNNAGIIQAGPIECMTVDDFQRTMQTHFWGPLYTIEAVLPQMRRRRQGRIVNISSIGGKISVPHLVPYCASKFALAGLSEGLRSELGRHGITVTTVFPGVMRTGSPRNAEFKGNHQAEYAWFSIASSLPVVSTNSRLAARRIIEACRHGTAEVSTSIPAEFVVRGHAVFKGLSQGLLRVMSRFLPRPVYGDFSLRKGWQSYSRWSPSWLTSLNERAAIRNHELLSSENEPSQI